MLVEHLVSKPIESHYFAATEVLTHRESVPLEVGTSIKGHLLIWDDGVSIPVHRVQWF